MSKQSICAINTQRAGWAASGLRAFQDAVDEHDVEPAMADLIADLGHLARKYRLDCLAVLRRALRSWAIEERDPDGLGRLPLVSIRIRFKRQYRANDLRSHKTIDARTRTFRAAVR